uniref:Uncharacterized protein n=1 Tax=Anguilla anguilla TaxID=7936 RepID=A0A0E9UEN3_ANGAN
MNRLKRGTARKKENGTHFSLVIHQLLNGGFIYFDTLFKLTL